jgi:hypothetical protein
VTIRSSRRASGTRLNSGVSNCLECQAEVGTASEASAAHAGHALEQFVALAPRGTRLDHVAQIRVRHAKLALQKADVRLEALLHEPLALPEDLAGAIPLALQHLEELAPPGEQGLELLRLVGRDKLHRGTNHVGEASQNVRVDAVRLRELARRLGEVAHLPRVHHHHGQRRRREGGHAQQLVPSRRLEHDQRRPERPKTLGWDPRKAASNRAKHRISFDEAATARARCL